MVGARGQRHAGERCNETPCLEIVRYKGSALATVFLGRAAGKFVCGWLGARVGVLLTVLPTEGGTAACIVGVLVLPLVPLFVLLPLLGVMLNGISSVLYGTVPDLAPP